MALGDADGSAVGEPVADGEGVADGGTDAVTEDTVSGDGVGESDGGGGLVAQPA
ncbi:hypothetical protein [Demequina sp. NBRC 110056]|uniref:hypothetical protein n=1 Tax=Demequina sp. NBRC 110056 TaxID=1570345 RepID=UPI00135657B3|nr:hypothetical protein [Demequina sp. NBRC 110056]